MSTKTSCSELPKDRSKIATEKRHDATRHLHEMAPAQAAALLLECSRSATDAACRAATEVGALVEEIAPRFKRGGRLLMIGAGSSGRLAAAEAAEMPPTFQLDPNRIIGLIAGGRECLLRSSEGLEDEQDGAKEKLEELQLTKDDTIIGITAGGNTPYVIGALKIAQERGALTALITSVKAHGADHIITLPTGAEPLTGSTRMNAATGAKVVLNAITTTLMAADGRIHENLMIAVNASNQKLRDRAARIYSTLTGSCREEAFSQLEQNGNNLRDALPKKQPETKIASDSPLNKWLSKKNQQQIVCIDGGGTKTAMQILDRNYNPISEEIIGGPLNIHDIGEDGVRSTLNSLLQKVPKENSLLVAGVAGAERSKENEILHKLFSEQGFEKRWIKGDGDLLLDAIHPTGLVLIAGTGSHCIGIHNGKRARAGGLGRILGDEGSGYFIGLQAIKAALSHRYGWGKPTALTDALLKTYAISDPEELMQPINGSQIGKAEIAKFAPEVIKLAESDAVAKNITYEATQHLMKLVRHTMRQLDLPHAPLHLIGGLLNSPLLLEPLTKQLPITPISLIGKNPAVWSVQNQN